MREVFNKVMFKIKNTLLISGITVIFIALTLLGNLFISNNISAQRKIYDLNIPPSIEGISLTQTRDDVLNFFEKKHIYKRYMNINNHITWVDPYLLYSQRYYKDYFPSFIPVTLCDGNDYLLRFDDLSIDKNLYAMLKDDEQYNVIYKRLYSIKFKDMETLRRINQNLKNNGLIIYMFDNTVYKIIAEYNFNLDELNTKIKDYNNIYGEYKTNIREGKQVLRWESSDHIIEITIDEETLENIESIKTIDYHRGTDAYYYNSVRVELFNSHWESNIVRYKSDIYMDIVRKLSFEYKNKIDEMNELLCDY